MGRFTLYLISILILSGQAVWANEKGFISIKNAEFELTGELELELVDTNNDTGIDEPEAHFQLDKFVLKPKLNFGNHLTLSAEYEMKQQANESYLKKVQAKFPDLGLPYDIWLNAGLYERWINGHAHRTTEGYPLLGNAFWRDSTPAISLGGEYKNAYWMLSVGNGYEINHKQVSEDSSYKIIHDNAQNEDFYRLEYGINLGVKKDFESSGKINALAFYYTDELSDDDIIALQGYISATGYTYTSDKRDKNRFGIGIDYRIQDLRLYGQYIDATDGKLDRDGWYFQASYRHKLEDRKSFTAIEPVVRYDQLKVDWENIPANPETWDREQIALALITDLYKNVKLKTEYYINSEDTGNSKVDNNEFLIQLEIKF